MPARRDILLGAGAALLAGCASSAPTAAGASRSAGPGRGPWAVSTPDAHGLSAPALEAAAARLGEAGERQGLVVIRHGALVFERYWENAWAKAEPGWKNVSFSSGKSWGATMVGRAVTLGRLSVDDLCERHAPSASTGLRPGTRVRHLLSMTSGGTLNMKPSSKPPPKRDTPAPPGPGVDYAWHAEPERGTPPGYGTTLQPGQRFHYDGAPADHLADIVAAAVGRTSHAFMMDEVVAPLGCEHFSYQPEGIDRNGNVRIGGSITLSCRDMARLGQLYLNGGRWAGRQLIAADFIRDAVTPSAHNPAYGYLWWLNASRRTPNAPASMYFAAGARGQFCFVLPEHDMVIATMGFGATQLSATDAWTALGPVLPRI